MSNLKSKDHKPKGESKMKTKIIPVILISMLAMIFAININAQPPKGDKDKKTPMMMGKIFDKLNLTDVQKDKIAKLKTDFQKKMIDLKSNLQKDMVDLKALRNKDDVTRGEVIASVEKVNKVKNEIALALANHLMDVREILTPEQRKMVKDHFPGMMDGMRKHKMMERFGGRR
ncbi:MAG: hypothetical protein CO128_09710 [Ignavibacteriales bacterium CG_4_9_14_3_um_filter_30_11]|nr:MAG: hypothetical protein CO128_09710 [Ignavibacteriales bacterium CG_4_9_14_3_um_filter_30_11]